MILKMESADLGFRFEWHPEARAVYALTFAGGKHEQIAANIESAEAAQLAALMWCRGYQSRAREVTRRPGMKHYHLLAEGGQVGVENGFSVQPAVMPPANGGWPK